MNDLVLTSNQLSDISHFYKSIDYNFHPDDIKLFDQNGYDLTTLEQVYASEHGYDCIYHRPSHIALKYEWFMQEEKYEGAVINHCNLFERKGFAEDAKHQLELLTNSYPILYKIIKMRPKWGCDFSIDYCDREGNVFEILHWEWDSIYYHEHIDKKLKYEKLFLDIDWDDAGKQLLKKKDEWWHLGFFEQSDYKCKYFGVEPEQFKMVLWEK